MTGRALARARGAALWMAGASASAWLSAWALRGPPERPPTGAPVPSPRPPTAAERAAAEARASAFAQAWARAVARRGGAPLPVHELESADPAGQPWLPEGIPDNPLMPGVGHVVEGCGPPPAALLADWQLCLRTGEVWALGADQGNEKAGSSVQAPEASGAASAGPASPAHAPAAPASP